MIGCMTCSWAPTAGGTTAQTGQRNDGAMALNTQQLHYRLSHINRTLHADIEKPTTFEKTFNNLQEINFYFFDLKNKLNLVNKFAFDCWHNTILWYTIHNTQHKIHRWFIISFETFFGLVKAVFGEMVCLSWISLGTGGSWTVFWQRQMMFVDSDRRWLLTATDDQFVDRCTIYWQLTVWFWNADSHCAICGQRPMDICYYGVGGRNSRTRCLVPSAVFRCWTCFLDSGSNR